MAKDFIRSVQRGIALDKDNGWIFGLCAGIANRLGTDPAIVRVAVLVAALFFPKIVIASYLVLWLIVDDRSVEREPPEVHAGDGLGNELRRELGSDRRRPGRRP